MSTGYKPNMRALMDRLAFEGTLVEFFASVRASDSLRFPNTDQGRDQYLEAARSAIDAMKVRLPDYFGVLPKAELTIKRVEPFRGTERRQSLLPRAAYGWLETGHLLRQSL